MNPYLPTWEYIPDTEPRAFGDRLYVFGSHDRFGGDSFCMNDYVSWSCPLDDLDDWRYEGVIWRRAWDPRPVTEEAEFMYAPDVVCGVDGRYYLYYGCDMYNRIAVAVCDTPAGEYRYLGEVHYPDGTRYGGRDGEVLRFDPGVLSENGRTYLYTGFSCVSDFLTRLSARFGYTITGAGSEVVELADDMMTVITEPKQVIPGKNDCKGTEFEGHEFFEASSVRHFGDKYYLIYSSGLSHELVYAMSDKPDGGFRYMGTLHSNGNIGFDGNTNAEFYYGNNHGSIVEIGGKYYIFGHRHTGKSLYSRQGVAEMLTMNPDGSFAQVKMTSGGLSGVLKADRAYESVICCVLYDGESACYVKSGSDAERRIRAYITQDGSDRECGPGQYIENVHEGTTIGYRYFDLSKPVRFSLSLCGDFVGKAFVRAEKNGEVIAEIQIAKTNEIASFSCELPALTDRTAIYLTFAGEGAFDLYEIAFE